MLCWPAKPLPVPRATCQVCDWHSSWHALTDGLALILALALHWPSTPMPTSGVHDVLHSQSLVFMFGVLHVCVHGPSRLHLWLCIHVRVCGLMFVFVFVFAFMASHSCLCLCLRPCICVRVCSPSCSCSCSCSRLAPCICCVHNCPLTHSHLCRVHLDRL
jgi:hypothetical protein